MSRFVLCTFLALAVTACGGDSPTTPDVTLPNTITDTYAGTLVQNGAERFTFVTASSGLTRATIIALEPAETIVSFQLGSYVQSTGVCSVMLANDRATLNTEITGQSDRAGNLCVRIADPQGKLTDPVAYRLQVVHY